MRTCIAHQLRRCIKAHRLAVEQRTCERGGLVALEPRRVVDEQRETRGMRLGKAILTEAEHLLIDTLGELARVVPLAHARKQSLTKGIEPSGSLPGAHR